MSSQISLHYFRYLSKHQQKQVLSWINGLICDNFNFDLFTQLVQCDARLNNDIITRLKAFLRGKVEAEQTDKGNHRVLTFPTKQPYGELVQVGYWCFLSILKAEYFREFLGICDEFDFYYEYEKFDFSKFEVSWLLNLNQHALEQIAKNNTVKEKIRMIVARSLAENTITPMDSRTLNAILIRYFC